MQVEDPFDVPERFNEIGFLGALAETTATGR
jgi:hypothetical protein